MRPARSLFILSYPGNACSSRLKSESCFLFPILTPCLTWRNSWYITKSRQSGGRESVSSALDIEMTRKMEWQVPRTETEGRRVHVRYTPSASPGASKPASSSLSAERERLRCSPSDDNVNLRLLARNLGLWDWTKASDDT